MPQRPGDGAGGRDHGAPRFPRPPLVRLLPGLSFGGNALLGITLAGFVGLAQIPPYDAAADQGAAARDGANSAYSTLGSERREGLKRAGAPGKGLVPAPDVTGASIGAHAVAARIAGNGLVLSLASSARTAGVIRGTGASRGETARRSAVPRSVPPERLTGYRWPLTYATITTWFAPTARGFVVIRGQRVHDGIDLATSCGDTVRAAHSGTVLHAGREFDRYLGYITPPDEFYRTVTPGNPGLTMLPIVVVVDDGNGYRSVYAHLSSARVRKGQRVRVGQPLGVEGSTGHSTGCHLHYSLIRMDGEFQAVAPEFVTSAHYPPFVRERVDPLRALSFLLRGAPRQMPGIPPPVPPIR